MAPSRRNIEDILARVNFPLYTLQMLTKRHVIVGGGGGSSKTGVANGFEIFELSHDGSKFAAEEVTRHETGRSVVMNCSVYSDNKRSFLVAGQESHCQLYNVECIVVTDEVEDVAHEIRQRKKSKQSTNAVDVVPNPTGQPNKQNSRNSEEGTIKKVDNNRNSKTLQFVIKPLDSVQTDFDGDEPLLRVSRIDNSGKIMATGGTDGMVKLWEFPSLQPLKTLKAHQKEIDDMDFSQNYLITIAKDGIAILWDCTKGKEIRRLTWQQPEGSRYLYKRCRFGTIEGEDNKSSLYMLSNPTGQAKKQKSYLQCWNPEEGVIKKVAQYDESLSALAVRDDGRFVAIGTMFSGSVAIHIAFSLQRVLIIPGAHSMFVTGLEFLPVSGTNHTVTSVAEAAVLSISVDNHVCIHTLPYRRTMPAYVGILILIVTLFLTFVFCSYLDI